MAHTANTRRVGANEAKTQFAELLRHVESGNEVIITRSGAAVARLIPAANEESDAQRRAAILAWQKSSRGLTLAPLKVRDLKK